MDRVVQSFWLFVHHSVLGENDQGITFEFPNELNISTLRVCFAVLDCERRYHARSLFRSLTRRNKNSNIERIFFSRSNPWNSRSKMLWSMQVNKSKTLWKTQSKRVLPNCDNRADSLILIWFTLRSFMWFLLFNVCLLIDVWMFFKSLTIVRFCLLLINISCAWQ